MGFWGEKEPASQILEGTFDTLAVKDKYLRLLLDQIRTPMRIKEAGVISTTITLDEHIREWRKRYQPQTHWTFGIILQQPFITNWLKWTDFSAKFTIRSDSHLWNTGI